MCTSGHLGLGRRVAFLARAFSQMASYRSGLTLLVVLASAGCAFGVGLTDVIGLIKLGYVVIHGMGDWETTLSHLHLVDKPVEDMIFMKVVERELLNRMDQVSEQIREFEERMENKVDSILTQLLVRLPMQGSFDNSMRDLDHYIGQVQERYKLFEMYASNYERYEKFTILQFAKTCVSPSLGQLSDVLKSIHRLMVPSDQQVYNRSILVLLANQMEVGFWCVRTVSEDVIEDVGG